MKYGRVLDEKTGGYPENPGHVFQGNYGGLVGLDYGDAVTFAYKPHSDDPAVDCVGFVGMVYHSAGLLRDREAMNEWAYNKVPGVLEATLKPAGWENKYLQDAYNNNYYWYLADSLAGKVKTSSYRGARDDQGRAVPTDFRAGGGVGNLFYNDHLQWQNDPIPGDIMFMDGHVGIYGERRQDDGTLYQRLMIHSAPANRMGYESGPRIQTFLKLGIEDKNSQRDSYMQWLVGASYFTKFYNVHGYNYARWWR